VSFYLSVLNAYIQNIEVGKVNWKEIWLNTTTVSSSEWDAIRQQLRESYYHLIDALEDMEAWGENAIAGSLAILSHTAYHLGAVRQILASLK
jgi:hypothetical protein